MSIYLSHKLNLALRCFETGDLNSSELMLKEILSIDSRCVGALILSAIQAALQNRLEEAERILRRVLTIDKKNYDAHFNLGKVLADQGKTIEAIRSYRQATALIPGSDAAWLNLGESLMRQQSFEQAIEAFDNSIKLNSSSAEAYSNKSICLRRLKAFDEAFECVKIAIDIKPSMAAAWLNFGNIYHDLRQHEFALQCYQKAIELESSNPIGWSNAGNELGALNRFEEALHFYEKALSIDQTHISAWSNRGNTLDCLRRHDEAIASFERALSLNPEFPDVHWNLALTLLRLGKFERGWSEYEWRWRYDGFCSPSRNFKQPLWLGAEKIDGKSLLIHSEQGLGDTIHFSRYVSHLKLMGARVILEVQPELSTLMDQLPGVDSIVPRGSSHPKFDYHCPLMSVPYALKAWDNKTTVPYLHVNRTKSDHWRSLMNMLTTKPKVGLVWCGNPEHKNDHNRSIKLSMLEPLLENDICWINLQKGILETDREILNIRGVHDFMSNVVDFSDTAAIIDNLDLVITVDTSVAHLAGAIGKPVWVLIPFIPDFRWMWDVKETHWYPHMRLFRQHKPGDWTTPIGSIISELGVKFDMCQNYC